MRKRPKRDAIDIVPRYGGIIIRDRWASCFSYDYCGHALCGSNLLKELIFIMASSGYAWAVIIKRQLQEIF